MKPLTLGLIASWLIYKSLQAVIERADSFAPLFVMLIGVGMIVYFVCMGISGWVRR